MHDPNTPTAMQEPLTHEEKWAEAEEEMAAELAEWKRQLWKTAGRPHCAEEEYLPPHLWKNPPREWWEEAA